MSLIHYWPLDEESGAVAQDVITEVDADVLNAPAIVQGKFGGARDFSQGTGGTGAVILRPTDNNTNQVAEWSVVCAVKQGASASVGYPQLWDFKDGGPSMYLDVGAGEVETRFYNTDSSFFIRTLPFDISDGLWHWIVVRWSAGLANIIIDGNIVAVIDDADPTRDYSLVPLAANTSFGAWNGSPDSDVVADELAIFNHFLSDEEVAKIGTASIGDLYLAQPFIPPEAPTRIYYAAELRKFGSDPLRLPISSWQATLQTGRQSYLQCVVPAAESYIDNITAMGLTSTLTVIRGALLPDGETTELDMAAVPLEQMPYQRGAMRSTVTLSGYGTINFNVVDTETPPAGSIRTLEGVQTLSVDNSGTRARSQIDWLLRPGLLADADGTQFQVAYINYYVNNAQEFMDCGSRAL